MDVLLVIPLAIFVVAAATKLVLTAVPVSRARAARRLAESLGLGLDPTELPRVAGVVAMASRAVVLGGMLGLAGGVGVVAALGRLPIDDPYTQWLIVAPTSAGFWLGRAAGALLTRRPAPGERVRVAHARRVTVVDYVPPRERSATLAVVAAAALAALVVALATAAVDGSWSFTGPALATAALAVLALGGFRIAARAILARPSPAGTARELAWEDALRSVALRQLIGAPLALAAVSIVWSMFGGILLLPREVGLVAANVAIWLVLYGGVVAAVVFVTKGRPQQHVLRRLSPELAGGPTSASGGAA